MSVLDVAATGALLTALVAAAAVGFGPWKRPDPPQVHAHTRAGDRVELHVVWAGRRAGMAQWRVLEPVASALVTGELRLCLGAAMPPRCALLFSDTDRTPTRQEPRP